MRRTALIILVLLFSAPLLGDSFSQADLHPYVRVHGSRAFRDIVGGRHFDDQDYFITSGGAMLAIEPSKTDNRNFTNSFSRGAGTPERLVALKQVLAQNRVGQQTSCEIDTEGDLIGPYEITWYGKSGRRNSFTVIHGPGGASGLPPCPPGVDLMIGAINDYVSHVRSRPGTEILIAP